MWIDPALHSSSLSLETRHHTLLVLHLSHLLTRLTVCLPALRRCLKFRWVSTAFRHLIIRSDTTLCVAFLLLCIPTTLVLISRWNNSQPSSLNSSAKEPASSSMWMRHKGTFSLFLLFLTPLLFLSPLSAGKRNVLIIFNLLSPKTLNLIPLLKCLFFLLSTLPPEESLPSSLLFCQALLPWTCSSFR